MCLCLCVCFVRVRLPEPPHRCCAVLGRLHAYKASILLIFGERCDIEHRESSDHLKMLSLSPALANSSVMKHGTPAAPNPVNTRKVPQPRHARHTLSRASGLKKARARYAIQLAALASPRAILPRMQPCSHPTMGGMSCVSAHQLSILPLGHDCTRAAW